MAYVKVRAIYCLCGVTVLGPKVRQMVEQEDMERVDKEKGITVAYFRCPNCDRMNAIAYSLPRPGANPVAPEGGA